MLVRQILLKIKLLHRDLKPIISKSLRPLLCISFPQGFVKFKKFGHWTSGSGGKKTFKWSEQRKKSVKNFFGSGDFGPFLSKNVQISDHLFSLLFPKDSVSLKILNIQLLEVGAKRRLDGTSKVNKLRNKILKKISWVKLGVNTKFVLGLSWDLHRFFEQQKHHLKSVTSDRRRPSP